MESDQKLPWVRPGGFVKAFNSNPLVIFELSPEDHIGGSLSILGYYVVAGEAGRGGLQLVEAILPEHGQCGGIFTQSPIL